jgi:hypothetical protein
MKKFAVVCGEGIGDGLLMHIAANHLRNLGFAVVTFSSQLIQLSDWFPGFSFAPQPKLEEIRMTLDTFDGIILQFDNTAKSKKIQTLFQNIYTFYGSYPLTTSLLLHPDFDVKFDPTICMAENISYAMQTLFPDGESELANGLVAPSHLVRNRFPNRVVLHPTSSSPEKNWPSASFLFLRDKLEQVGWDPVFIASPSDAHKWGAPKFLNLSDLAAFLYESGYFIGNDSGPGHLASNLGIQTVIIGSSKEHLTFWRPGWRRGELAHPPNWATKFKLTRENWKIFISLNRVIKQFKKLTDVK